MPNYFLRFLLILEKADADQDADGDADGDGDGDADAVADPARVQERDAGASVRGWAKVAVPAGSRVQGQGLERVLGAAVEKGVG